jgi:hypothetical protein
MTIRPAVFDRKVLTFEKTRFLQTFAECSQKVLGALRGRTSEKTDHRNRPPLRARRHRPCCRRAANE